MLIVSIVHHGNRSLLLVFDARDLLCIEETRLVSIELTANPERHMHTVQKSISKELKPCCCEADL